MSDDKQKDKRRHPRHPLDEEVLVDFDGKTVKGDSRNISNSGVSIKSETPIPNDQFVQLHLGSVGDIEGRVVRNFDNGFAVEFDVLSKETVHLEDKLKNMFAKADDEPKDERELLEDKFAEMFESDKEEEE